MDTHSPMPLPASKDTALPPPPSGWHHCCYAILNDGSLGRLISDSAAYADDPRGDRSARLRVLTFDGDTFLVRLETAATENYPIFDRFTDGRWLLTSRRIVEGDNPRRSGAIYAPDGTLLNDIMLGDGIEHMKIDDQNRIWVGWFDEGVFGNDRWSWPGRDWPPSSDGIAAFDASNALVANGPDIGVADCYALNVHQDGIWACSYADFPILRYGPGGAWHLWASPVIGPRALAVSYPYVLLAGGYPDQHDDCHLLRLSTSGAGTGKAEVIGRWTLPLGSYSDTVRLIEGRGPGLHIVSETHWHRWNIHDFIKAATG